MNGKLAEWFTWHDVQFSELAERHDIDNAPPADLEHAIRFTAQGMDQIRRRLQLPVLVSSWYRCLELNRLIKSSDTSQHPKGEAVDWVCPAYGSPEVVFELIRREFAIKYDQLILEAGKRSQWIHTSFRREKWRRHAFLMNAVTRETRAV